MALLPDSAAAFTAPVAAPAAAPVTIGPSLFSDFLAALLFLLALAVLLTPDLRAVLLLREPFAALFAVLFEAREVVDFLALGLLELLEVDFLEPDCFRAFFVAIFALHLCDGYENDNGFAAVLNSPFLFRRAAGFLERSNPIMSFFHLRKLVLNNGRQVGRQI